MFTSQKEKFQIKTQTNPLNALKITYKAQQDFHKEEKNDSIDCFQLQQIINDVDNEFAKGFNISKAWFHVGGWQSWAPGWEVAPGEKQAALKNFAIPQWNVYLTVPQTEKKYYRRSRFSIGHFVIYFRYEEKYFVIASVGNTKNVLPPVQYIYDKIKKALTVQLYDCGKEWKKDELASELVFFAANSYFEAKDALHALFATEEFAGKECASRFENLKFLGKVPGGWESWYNHYANINEALILEDLKSLCSTENIISMMYLQENKPTVFQIDDGWEYTVGQWDIRQDRFPNGLKTISDKIEEHGMIPGLWIAPFLVDLRSPLYKEHPEWVLTDEKGIPVGAGFNPLWGAKDGEFQPGKSGTFYCLDLSNDEVLDFLDKLMDKAINEWGIRYLKLDFLYAGMLYGEFKNKGSAYEWYARAVKTLTKRNKTNEGKPVAYLGCGMPFEHSFKDFPLSRIGCDTYEHWENTLIKMIGWNGRCSAYLNLKDTIGRAMWNNSIHMCDPDVVFVRKENCSLTTEEKLVLATTNLIFGNQFMYSDDPERSCSTEEVELAKQIVQISQKFEGEEFSVIPSSIDVFEIKSRSGNYEGTINLKKKEIVWKKAK